MRERSVSALILAAGEGTRMRSSRPKPLHLLCGRAMLLYVLDALKDVTVERAVIVVGHGAERVTKKMQEDGPDILIDFIEQHVQRGTGDAVSVGLTSFPEDDLDDGDVLVLPGDTPLLRPSTIAALVREHRLSEAACTVLTAVVDDATGYGRVVRGKDGRVARIVEEADAAPDEREIREINTSIYCFRRSVLAPALRRVSPENAQGEYYLTDVVEVLYEAGYPVLSVVAGDPDETQGVNDRHQLALAEAALRRRTNDMWMHRRHDARPRAHLRRCRRAPGAGRHPVPRDAAPGQHGRRRTGRDRARHPSGRLRRRSRRGSRTDRWPARGDRRGRGRRSLCGAAAGRPCRSWGADGSVLHCEWRRGIGVGGSASPHGAHHQEDHPAVFGACAPGPGGRH